MKIIPITKGKVVFVDDEDFALVNQKRWCAIYNEKSKTWYAVAPFLIDGKRKIMRMHRILMEARLGELVDHKDHNGLNNQRKNLRKCNTPENSRNRRITPHTSKYKGVYQCNKTGKWRAQICVDMKCIALGTFADQESAARAYDKAAKKNFGEFALLNNPVKQREMM